jgi:hypothetical protein
MSVPGRIGLILIIALAIVDAIILMSGARHAASAIDTHAMLETPQAPIDSGAAAAPSLQAAGKHEPLLSSALRQINLLMNRARDTTTRT